MKPTKSKKIYGFLNSVLVNFLEMGIFFLYGLMERERERERGGG